MKNRQLFLIGFMCPVPFLTVCYVKWMINNKKEIINSVKYCTLHVHTNFLHDFQSSSEPINQTYMPLLLLLVNTHFRIFQFNFYINKKWPMQLWINMQNTYKIEIFLSMPFAALHMYVVRKKLFTSFIQNCICHYHFIISLL